MPGENSGAAVDPKQGLVAKSFTKGAFYAIPLTVLFGGVFNYLAFAGVQWTPLTFSLVAAAVYVASFALTGVGSYVLSSRAIARASVPPVVNNDDDNNNDVDDDAALISHPVIPRPARTTTTTSVRSVVLNNIGATVVAASASALNCESTAYTIAALMAASNDSNDPVERQRAYEDALFQARLSISLFCVIGAYVGFNMEYVLNLFQSCCQPRSDESSIRLLSGAASANYGAASSSPSLVDPDIAAERERAGEAASRANVSLTNANNAAKQAEADLRALSNSAPASPAYNQAAGIIINAKGALALVRQQAKLAEQERQKAVDALDILVARQGADAAQDADNAAADQLKIVYRHANAIATLKDGKSLPADYFSSSSSSSSASASGSASDPSRARAGTANNQYGNIPDRPEARMAAAEKAVDKANTAANSAEKAAKEAEDLATPFRQERVSTAASATTTTTKPKPYLDAARAVIEAADEATKFNAAAQASKDRVIGARNSVSLDKNKIDEMIQTAEAAERAAKAAVAQLEIAKKQAKIALDANAAKSNNNNNVPPLPDHPAPRPSTAATTATSSSSSTTTTPALPPKDAAAAAIAKRLEAAGINTDTKGDDTMLQRQPRRVAGQGTDNGYDGDDINVRLGAGAAAAAAALSRDPSNATLFALDDVATAATSSTTTTTTTTTNNNENEGSDDDKDDEESSSSSLSNS